MLFKLFLCFTLIPAVEIYLLVKIGTVIGSFNTVLLVIATGFFGAWLARMEGLNTMFKVRQSLERGIMPEEELMDALIIFFAGILLIAPGLLTDVFGLLLLWPVTRNTFKLFLRQKMKEFNDSKDINITRYY